MTNWDIHDDSLATEGTRRGPARQPVPGRPAVERELHELRRGRQLHRRAARGRLLDGVRQPVHRQRHDRPVRSDLPQATMLSDGKVDAGDAPMPAAQIDVTIKDNNTLDPTDIGGVGISSRAARPRSTAATATGSDRRATAKRGAQPLRAVLLAVHPGDRASGRRAGSPYGAAPPERHRRLGRAPTASAGSSSKGHYRNWSFAWTSSRHADGDLQVPVLADRCRASAIDYPPAAVRHTTPSRSTRTRAARPT